MMRRLMGLAAGLVLVAGGGLTALVWFTCRLYVPENMCAVLTAKTGRALPMGQTLALEPGQKGIQEQVLGPGRHWRIPFFWDWKLVDLTVVPAGDPKTWEWTHSLNATQRDQLREGRFRFKGDFPMIGVVTRKVGLTTDETIVDRGSGKKGILREVLTSGTYKINPEIYDVALHPATVIPAGFVGVVTNMFGDAPTGVADPAGEGGELGSSTPDFAGCEVWNQTISTRFTGSPHACRGPASSARFGWRYCAGRRPRWTP